MINRIIIFESRGWRIGVRDYIYLVYYDLSSYVLTTCWHNEMIRFFLHQDCKLASLWLYLQQVWKYQMFSDVLSSIVWVYCDVKVILGSTERGHSKIVDLFISVNKILKIILSHMYIFKYWLQSSETSRLKKRHFITEIHFSN